LPEWLDYKLQQIGEDSSGEDSSSEDSSSEDSEEDETPKKKAIPTKRKLSSSSSVESSDSEPQKKTKKSELCQLPLVDTDNNEIDTCSNECVASRKYQKCNQCHRWIRKKKRQCQLSIGFGKQKYCDIHC